jgi:hypothetical protein
MNIFLGTAPKFYTDTKDDLIARKISGTDKGFDEKTRRRLAHGREREASILKMAGKALGYPVARHSWFIVNDRWPLIGTTLDGLLMPVLGFEPMTELLSEAWQVEGVRGLLYPGRPCLVEIKNTDGGHRWPDKQGTSAGKKPWIDFCPTYHHEQVQTAMWVADVDQCVLVGSLGADDFSVWWHERDPGWTAVLDQVNAEATDLLRGIQ